MINTITLLLDFLLFQENIPEFDVAVGKLLDLLISFYRAPAKINGSNKQINCLFVVVANIAMVTSKSNLS